MISEFSVAVFASVINAATSHLDRDDVVWTVIVSAAHSGIEVDAAHLHFAYQYVADRE
jgi:hypothetical protein